MSYTLVRLLYLMEGVMMDQELEMKLVLLQEVALMSALQ